LISRRQILQAACETLADPASRREYNQSLIDDDEDSSILTEIPFDKVSFQFHSIQFLHSKKMINCVYFNDKMSLIYKTLIDYT
jgi:hypothetical protein